MDLLVTKLSDYSLFDKINSKICLSLSKLSGPIYTSKLTVMESGQKAKCKQEVNFWSPNAIYSTHQNFDQTVKEENS